MTVDFGQTTTVEQLMQDGQGAIEFSTSDGIIAFNAHGVALGLDNGSSQAMIGFEVQDGKLVFVTHEINDYPSFDLDHSDGPTDEELDEIEALLGDLFRDLANEGRGL